MGVGGCVARERKCDKFSDQTNRTSSSSSSIEPGSSMWFDGSVEPRSSIDRTKIEPNPYQNELFSLFSNNEQQKIFFFQKRTS